MTDEDLDAIEKRAKEATPGPWKLWAAEVRADPVGDSNLDTSVPVARTYDTRNAKFVACARADVPALVAEIRRLREENSELRAISGVVR